ncbi:hypothetical protein M758_9G047600 [Ceratodon purpureus]|nr:hypothetical protein M758_9G047600 [Ceratodon purpureus]
MQLTSPISYCTNTKNANFKCFQLLQHWIYQLCYKLVISANFFFARAFALGAVTLVFGEAFSCLLQQAFPLVQVTSSVPAQPFLHNSLQLQAAGFSLPLPDAGFALVESLLLPA